MKKHLIHRENNFQQDERDNNSFQAQRTFSVNDIRQGLSRVGDNGQLSRQEIGALFYFLLILKPRVKPFQVRPLPKYVGFFCNCNETRHALLHQQCISNVFQDRPTATRGAPMFR